MTTDGRPGEIDQDLLPDRSDSQDIVWYIGGAGATALATGILGMVNYLPSYPSMAMTGAVLFGGMLFWQWYS